MSPVPLSLRDLALASGLFAIHADAIIGGSVPPAQTLLDYTVLSRQRLNTWWPLLQPSEGFATDRPDEFRNLAEEILVSEMLARVVVAALESSDARRNASHAAPFGRRVLLDQLQAKHLVLGRLLKGPQPLGLLLRINRLRKRIERWSDFLLALLPSHPGIDQYALDHCRLAEFRDRPHRGTSSAACQLMLISLRLSIPATGIADPKRSALHREILQLLFSLWPRDAFDSSGLLRGLLGQRLRGLTDLPTKHNVFAGRDAPSTEFAVLRRIRRMS